MHGITPENPEMRSQTKFKVVLMAALEYLIHGHDIETFHDVANGKKAFATSSSEGLQARVEQSTMVAFLAEHGFVNG